LASQAVPSIAKQKDAYFKHVIIHRGIKTPAVDAIFKEKKDAIRELVVKDTLKVAAQLLESKYGEDKQLGILVLKENVKQLDKTHLPYFEELIDSHVYDWGTCDCIAGKVIFEIIKKDKAVVPTIVAWKDSTHMWRQRASCVSFVKHARHGQFNKEIIDICSSCVLSKERFVQLGLGWVLRELSLADHGLVVKFIKSNIAHFSREGLRYAIEKMTGKDRTTMLNLSKTIVAPEAKAKKAEDEVGGNEQDLEEAEKKEEEEDGEREGEGGEEESEEEESKGKRRTPKRAAKSKSKRARKN